MALPRAWATKVEPWARWPASLQESIAEVATVTRARAARSTEPSSWSMAMTWCGGLLPRD